MISFSTDKLRKNVYFGPIRSLFSFLTAQTEKNSMKKFVKQIGENILMNSLDVLKMFLILCKKGGKIRIHYWYVRTATIVGILTSCQIKPRFKKCYQMIM